MPYLLSSFSIFVSYIFLAPRASRFLECDPGSHLRISNTIQNLHYDNRRVVLWKFYLSCNNAAPSIKRFIVHRFTVTSLAATLQLRVRESLSKWTKHAAGISLSDASIIRVIGTRLRTGMHRQFITNKSYSMRKLVLTHCLVVFLRKKHQR
jgi:hypothetical protein